MTLSIAASTRIGALAPGTELIVDERGYRHHGIYVGGGRVIHYRGWISTRHGLVEEIALAEFVGKRPCRAGRRPEDFAHSAEIVRRARSRLGERSYSLLRNNCEHLCNWCQIGQSRSAQVDRLQQRVRRIVELVRGWRSRPIVTDLQQLHTQPGR
ncbi:MAG: lecithin retinol acyltransferase family protein [Steroidobacteraceae bacterium]|jgi:hypothetical protein